MQAILSVFAQFSSALKATSGATSSFLKPLQDMTAVAMKWVAAIESMIEVMSVWVAALQPGLIARFNQSLRDLEATLGVAFTGVFDQGINFFAALAAVVLPLMQALKPVIDQLTDTIIKGLVGGIRSILPIFDVLISVFRPLTTVFGLLESVLSGIVGIFGLLMQVGVAPLVAGFTLLNAALGPIIKLFTAVFDGLAQLFQTFSTIFRVVMDTITSAFDFTYLQDTIKSVTDAFKELSSMVILVAAKFALMVGATEFVAKLRDALSGTGEKAAGQLSIKSLEQIGKDMALASVNAAGSTMEDATNRDIVKKLDELMAAEKFNADAIIRKLPGGETIADVRKTAIELTNDPVGYADRQLSKPGVFGYTSLNPF